MGILLISGLLLLNFAISAFNAWICGLSWYETERNGGFPRFMNWMGAIMSGCGFTWVYLIILAFLVSAIHWLPMTYVEAMLNLGYLIIIIPILGSGFAITVQSIIVAWRRRTLANVGVAGWNSFAQIYNTVQAISLIPKAFQGVMKVFGGK